MFPGSDGARVGLDHDARRAIELLRSTSNTVACAESLTGGSLTAAFVGVPGASQVVLGGVVAYAATLKESLLGVPAEVIQRHTVVSQQVAEHMAAGAARACGATCAVATTGEAGPVSATGAPVGTIWIAWWVRGAVQAQLIHGEGERSAVQLLAVTQALHGLCRRLGGLAT